MTTEKNQKKTTNIPITKPRHRFGKQNPRRKRLAVLLPQLQSGELSYVDSATSLTKNPKRKLKPSTKENNIYEVNNLKLEV